MTSTDTTATPTDSERRSGWKSANLAQREDGSFTVASVAHVVAQALADQRAKYDRLADELEDDSVRYQGTVLSGSNAFENAADRIRKVVQQ